jgi:hypothetical protein
MFSKHSQARSLETHPQDLERRLRAYYGPALPPHPLSEAAWLSLYDQLGSAHRATPSRLRMRATRPGRVRRDQATSASFDEAFAALLTQIDYRQTRPHLHYRQSARRALPQVRISLIGRGQLRLLLPQPSLRALEVEVLLAVGLARYASASRTLFLFSRTLLTLSLLLVVAALPFTMVDRRYLWVFCAACAGCIVGAGLISWQERVLAFRGDRQAVQWLGRERVCQGLHLLAEHGRPQRRAMWGEPTLTERITRVCGTSVPMKDDRLTLVG